MAQPADRSELWASAAAVVGILCFQAALGLYAVSLNALFYARFGPFYDSLGYFNGLIDIYLTARERGRWAAIWAALDTNATVVFPWIVYAPLARSFALQRGVGMWVQIVAATYMQFALYLYFRRVREMVPLAAVGWSAAFALIAAGFFFNGGLSDLRMDLLQYFLFTTMMASYLLARSTRAYGAWIAFGCSVGILCLGRATSPVYLAILFAVLVPVDVLAARSAWRAVLGRWLLAGAVAIALSGWFFIRNFERLYYYYFVWNLDANARLPLSTSIGHVRNAIEHVGRPLLVAASIVAVALVALHVRAYGMAALKQVSWRPLWFSAVPLGYLVLSGSGLNPFVSIVGVGGALLFLLDPIAARLRLAPPAVIALVTCLAVAGLTNAAAGIANNAREDRVSPWVPRQVGIAQVLDAIDAAVDRNQARTYRFAVMHIGSFVAELPFNVLVYDRGLPALRGRTVALGRAQLTGSVRGPATEVEWRRLPGTTDDEKVAALVARIEDEVDFFVMVSESSELVPWNYINPFIPDLNRRIMASGNWVPISGTITMSTIEAVRVLRNRRRP